MTAVKRAAGFNKAAAVNKAARMAFKRAIKLDTD